MSVSSRRDGRIQRNVVQVSVSKVQSSSPTYQLRLYRDGVTVADVSGRFAIYRDLYTVINSDYSCDKLVSSKFPPTLAKSSMGVKMSPQEVEMRRSMLDDFFRDLFNCFNDFPDQSRAAVAEFVKLSEADIELVPEPQQEPIAASESPERDISKGLSVKGFVSAIKRTVSSKSGADNEPSVGSVNKVSGFNTAEGDIVVYVSRGSNIGGHQTYEINIKYDPRVRRLIISKEFKQYRTLMQTLAVHGVRHKDYAKGENAIDADDDFIEAATFDKIIPISKPFPRTYKRSALGISLTEEALTDRCITLDKWVKDVLHLYHSFEPHAKDVVNRFLGYSEDYENEEVEQLIEKMNIPGSVVGNPVVEANEDESVLEDNEPTVFMKAVRRDTMMQKNSVLITQSPENGHPFYTLQIQRNGSLRGEVKGQFAIYRDLHMKLNADRYISDLLTAPFPATKRRSSLGFQLSNDMVEVRRQELNTWWIDLLDHFSDIKEECKDIIAEFLSIPRDRLELEDEATDNVAPAVNTPVENGTPVEPIVETPPTAAVFANTDRNNNLIQPNTAQITQAPENGHPVYTLRIVRSTTVLSEVKGQFAMYRDLFTKLNEEGFCDDLLTARFPATQRRSSLGIRLGDDLVESRRQELNMWWTDLLNHFNELMLERQMHVADFLGLSVKVLELIDGSAPPDRVKKGLVQVFGEVGDSNPPGEPDEMVDIDIDNVEPEWQEIPATPKPIGCCLIS